MVNHETNYRRGHIHKSRGNKNFTIRRQVGQRDRKIHYRPIIAMLVLILGFEIGLCRAEQPTADDSKKQPQGQSESSASGESKPSNQPSGEKPAAAPDAKPEQPAEQAKQPSQGSAGTAEKPPEAQTAAPGGTGSPDTTETQESQEFMKLTAEYLKAMSENADQQKLDELNAKLKELNAKIDAAAAKRASEAKTGEGTVPPSEVQSPANAQPTPAAPAQPGQLGAVKPTTPEGQTPAAAPPIPAEPPVGENVVRLKTQNSQVDVNYLIDAIGRELKLTFLYDTPNGISGTVKLQQYGEIQRQDLIPLLESVLRFYGYLMVREDPFIRISTRKEADASKRVIPSLTTGTDLAPEEPGDLVVSQILRPKNVDVEELQKFLGNFTDTTAMITDKKSNFLIITEYANRMPKLLEMYNLYDQPGPEKKLAAIEVINITASDAKKHIDDLLDALAGQGVEGGDEPAAAAPAGANPAQPQPRPTRRPRQAGAAEKSGGKTGVSLHVDDRTNRLLVIGTEAQIERVRQLLTMLDIKGGGLEVVLIKHVLVADLTTQLANLLKAMTDQTEAITPAPAAPAGEQPRRQPSGQRPRRAEPQGPTKAGVRGPALVSDERTNRLFIIGTQDQIRQAHELLDILDVPPYQYGQAYLKVYQPQFVEAEEVRRILEQLGSSKALACPPVTAPAAMKASDLAPASVSGPRSVSSRGCKPPSPLRQASSSPLSATSSPRSEWRFRNRPIKYSFSPWRSSTRTSPKS
jgi:hypothetical protein